MTSPSGLGPIASRIVPRSLLFVGVSVGITLASPASADGLGVGLLVFLVQATLALTLGLLDGWRRPQLQTLLEWIGVAVLGTILGSVYLALPVGYDQPWTWQTISEGLTTQLDPVTLPFMVGLIAVPAVAGVVLGWVSSHELGPSAPTSHRPGPPTTAPSPTA